MAHWIGQFSQTQQFFLVSLDLDLRAAACGSQRHRQEWHVQLCRECLVQRLIACFSLNSFFLFKNMLGTLTWKPDVIFLSFNPICHQFLRKLTPQTVQVYGANKHYYWVISRKNSFVRTFYFEIIWHLPESCKDSTEYPHIPIIT